MSPAQTAVTAVLTQKFPVEEDEAAKHSTVGELVAALNAKRA
ncbi:hypothetical protein OHU07_23185 [Streptomyces phaeochromogenes]